MTLIDADGEAHTATSGSSGLWSIDDLVPGVYTERYELAGYDPLTRAFALDAFGENDVSNPFVSLEDVLLEETRLSASVDPFAVELGAGDVLLDAVAGEVLIYDVSAGAPIVLVFSSPIFGGAVTLEDGVTNDFLVAQQDTAERTTFTFTAQALDALNGGSGLTVETIPGVWHEIDLTVVAYTPIHGDAVVASAQLGFNAE